MTRLVALFFMVSTLIMGSYVNIYAQTAATTPTASVDTLAIQKMKERIELEKLQLEEAELKLKLLKTQQQLTPQSPTATSIVLTPAPTNTPGNISDEAKKEVSEKFKLEQLKKAQELAKTNKDNATMFVLDTVNVQLWYKGVPYTAYELNRLADDQKWKGKKEVDGRNSWGNPRYLHQYLNTSLLKYDNRDKGILTIKKSDKPGDIQFITQDGFSFSNSSADVRINAPNLFFKYEGQSEPGGQKVLKYGYDRGIGFNEEIEFFFDSQDKMTMIRYGALGER